MVMNALNSTLNNWYFRESSMYFEFVSNQNKVYIENDVYLGQYDVYRSRDV